MIDFVYSHPFLTAWLVWLLLLIVVRKYQSRPMEFFYNKKDPLFNEFLAKSNITKMVYKPFLTGPIPILQAVTYLIHERVYQKVWPNVFGVNCEQELLKAPDGGTIGVLWQIGSDGKSKPPTVSEKCGKR